MRLREDDEVGAALQVDAAYSTTAYMVVVDDATCDSCGYKGRVLRWDSSPAEYGPIHTCLRCLDNVTEAMR